MGSSNLYKISSTVYFYRPHYQPQNHTYSQGD